MTRSLRLLLVAYLLLATAYSIFTPIFEASDELWHYPMVKYVADQHTLPIQQPGVETAWRQEGSQPPLYYVMAAVLTFWIDTSDLDAARKINPHADIGLVVPDGNANMTICDPAARDFPYHGTALAVHLARLLSVALGAITVWMTYLLARELFPEIEWIALIAAAFVAFNPMFLFISGSVNNDNLSNAAASAILVQIVRLLKRTDQPSWRELVGIGVLTGAGMLAKFNIGFLLPFIALALLLLAVRLRSWRFFITAAVITGGLTLLIAGWWYVRNWQLYGDPTGLNVFIQIVGPRAIPANWAQLWSERHTFLMSYWGFFGGVNVPLPDVVYTVFSGIAALSAVGLVIGLIRWRRKAINWPVFIGCAVTLVWIVVLFGGLIRWTSETWASQGRLMFAAIAPISLWMAVGLRSVGELVFGFMRLGPASVRRFVGVAALWFVALALISPVIISRAYGLDAINIYSGVLIDGAPVNVDFCEPDDAQICSASLHMVQQSIILGNVRVGDYFEFWVQMTVGGTDARFKHDWSAFVHLETPEGVIVAQRDIYLGQGLLATSLMYNQSSWYNRFFVHIPEFANTPEKLNVYLGFYDLKTGARMVLKPARSNDNRLLIGTVQLLPRTDNAPLPNPMNVNFGDEAELIGYKITPNTLLTHPGESVTVTFYWRAQRPMHTDYRVFAQIVEPNTTRVFARSDAMPAAWTRPTSSWKPDEIIEDTHTLPVDPNAPPGTWQLIVGLYEYRGGTVTGGDPEFRRLRVIMPDGAQADDFVGLTRVKIDLKQAS